MKLDQMRTGEMHRQDDVRFAGLAHRALSSILEEKKALSRAGGDEELVSGLCMAVLEDTGRERRALQSRFRSGEPNAAAVIDTVVPEAARMLGRLWQDDEISFADVTIGLARLQEMVRDLGRMRPETRGRQADGSHAIRRVLFIVPRSEDHTLGAIVATEQLRRHGCEVDVALDRHPNQIADIVRENRYALVGITASGRRTLASARELVDTIRAAVTRATPIVLGGSIVANRADLKGMTGVDHVVCDAREVLRLIGLNGNEGGLAQNAPSEVAGR